MMIYPKNSDFGGKKQRPKSFFVYLGLEKQGKM
jgi:hypothetical protein